MTDLDDRLRHDLASLAGRMQPTDVTDESVRRGQQRRLRRTTIAATTGVAVVVAAVVVPLTLAGRSTGHAPAGRPGRVSTPIGQLLRPLIPDTASEQDVAAPVIGALSEPGAIREPRCKPAEIHATAVTTPSAQGVVGTVTITATSCSAGLAATRPAALLGSDGQPLAVAVQTDRIRVNPPQEFPSVSGNAPVIWGFAWRGSWCGATPTTLRLAGGLVATLTGPTPTCHGRSSSVLVPGIAAQPGVPAQTPPPSWSALRVQLHVPHVVADRPITGLSVTLSNPTSRPIPLSPCPTYRLGVARRGGPMIGFSSGTEYGPRVLTCPPQPTVVPADGAVRLALTRRVTPARRGVHLQFQFAIAGVPTSTVHVRVT